MPRFVEVTLDTRTPGEWFAQGAEGHARRLGLGALAAAIVFSFWGTLGRPECQDMDFGAYYRGAAAVRCGETPYHADMIHGPMAVYTYAPAFAYCLIPLTCLDYPTAVRCWLLLNWLAILLSLLLAWRLVAGSTPGNHRWRMLWLAVVPVSAYVWDTLHAGQAALLVTLGCLGWAVLRRGGRPFAAGLVLALAGGLKVYPLILAPWLLIQRDTRGCAGLATGLLGLFLLPALWVGGAGCADLHVQWVRQTLDTQHPCQTYRGGNQSLLAVLARLPGISDGYSLCDPERLAALSRWYPVLLAMMAAGVYVALAWRYRRVVGPRGTMPTARRGHGTPFNSGASLTPPQPSGQDRWRDTAAYAVLFVLMTLAGPRSWRCNFTALILPCMLLAAAVCQRRRGWRAALAALALLIAVNIWRTETLHWTKWPWLNWLLTANHFGAAVAVAITCAAMPLVRRRATGLVRPHDVIELGSTCPAPAIPVPSRRLPVSRLAGVDALTEEEHGHRSAHHVS